MIYLVLGMPGRLGSWCAESLAHLLKGDGATVTVAEIAKAPLEEAALLLVRNRATHLVLYCHAADPTLVQALRETNARFVLALDDPRQVLGGMLAQGTDPVGATRFLAALCPTLLASAGLEGARIVTAQQVRANVGQAIARIAQHFGIAAPDTVLDGVLPFMDGAPSALSGAAASMAEGALGAYAAAFQGASLPDIIWPREFFIRTHAPSLGLETPVNLRDIANGHFLVHGPYLPLPAGSWSAKVVLGFSAEAVGQTIAIDVCNQALQLSDSKFLVRHPGLMSHDISFSLARDETVNLELRILVNRVSAPGQMAFGHIVFSPMTDRESVTMQGDFRQALSL